MTVTHQRVLNLCDDRDGRVTAGCRCGWTSTPQLNGEFANQEFERHRADAPTID